MLPPEVDVVFAFFLVVEEEDFVGLRFLVAGGPPAFAFEPRTEVERPPPPAAAAGPLVRAAAVLFFRGGVFF